MVIIIYHEVRRNYKKSIKVLKFKFIKISLRLLHKGFKQKQYHRYKVFLHQQINRY